MNVSINSSWLDEIKRYGYVIWGSGRIGLDFYNKYCKKHQILDKPLYWCDSNSVKWGTTIEGIKVISPKELFHLGRKHYIANETLAVVLGMGGGNLLQVVAQIDANDENLNIFFAQQLEANDYFYDQKDNVDKISNMFVDKVSKHQYIKVIQNITNGCVIDRSVFSLNPYIGNDVIPNLIDEEVFVDAGVCDGEEIDKALYMNPNVKVHAFEPDKQSYDKLKAKYNNKEQVQIYECALWNEEKRLPLFVDQTYCGVGSRIDIENTAVGKSVPAKALDNIVDFPVTFIKMDIEGAEYFALQGCANTIRDCKPKLAICLYHSVEDYVRIPLLVHELNSEYKFYFRHHCITNCGSVLYAI